MSAASPRHAAEAALNHQIESARTLKAERTANPIVDGALSAIADWQGRRLAQTYADFAAQPRYRAAVGFFLFDLYGSRSTAWDAQLDRVASRLSAALPERVIATVAHAMELAVMSEELDRLLLGRLPRAVGSFSVAEYCRAYRRMGNDAARRRQIELVGIIGEALDDYVRRSWIHASLSMMRTPARLAGYGAPHEFLERGFRAFRAMGGAQEFLTTIKLRETALLEKIFDGALDPFPDPLNRLGI
ncbi:MAG TPA: hypothetical protein VNE58_05750 [Casimicrobiaceae bacterium]|nr:hypothetical protein [Casimicrobiaceae bacterium]